MTEPKVVGIKQVSFAAPNDEGTGVVFGFAGHDGNEYRFACPSEAIGVILARLIGAAQHPAMVGRNPEFGIVVRKTRVGIHTKNKTVDLSLLPTEKTGIPFSMAASDAQKLSSDLAHAAAKLAPKKPKTAN